MTTQLSEAAEAQIRASILTGAYAFGERLSDRALADRLGISRTPIRLALSRLADSGLVVVKPQSGTTVMNPDPETIRACCDMRALLETGALRLAVASGRLTACSGLVREARAALASGDFARVDALDTAFHNALVAASGNVFLVQSYRAIADFVTAIRYRLPRDPTRYATAIEQHERILEHIRAGNLDLAETQLAEHVARVAQMSTARATGE